MRPLWRDMGRGLWPGEPIGEGSGETLEDREGPDGEPDSGYMARHAT